MMISEDQVNRVVAAAQCGVEGASVRMGSTVSAEIIEQATLIAHQTPDIRTDRVEVASRRILDDGVSSDEIATMMVRRIVSESLI